MKIPAGNGGLGTAVRCTAVAVAVAVVEDAGETGGPGMDNEGVAIGGTATAVAGTLTGDESHDESHRRNDGIQLAESGGVGLVASSRAVVDVGGGPSLTLKRRVE